MLSLSPMLGLLQQLNYPWSRKKIVIKLNIMNLAVNKGSVTPRNFGGFLRKKRFVSAFIVTQLFTRLAFDSEVILCIGQ